jgi:hypothetical protein
MSKRDVAEISARISRAATKQGRRQWAASQCIWTKTEMLFAFVGSSGID